MKRRDLNDIMREVQKQGVKDPETIRQYLRAFGDRTLYSLMYADREKGSEEERYECWSHLEFVLMAYTDLEDLEEEEILYCMKHITVKDFLCLIDHLNDQNKEPANCEEGAIIRNDFRLVFMRERALGYFLKLVLRAKGRGDKDVNHFCMIHTDTLYGEVEKKENSFETILDYFYEIKDSLNLGDKSWTSFRTMNKEDEFGCLRVLTVRCLERFCFGEKFDLHEVLGRCRNMCTQMAS